MRYLRICTFHLPLSLCKVWPHALIIASCAPGVTGALLVLVSLLLLASPPGALVWQKLPLCLGLPRLQPLLPQWGKLEGGVEAGVRGCQVYGPHHHKQGSGVSCAPVAKRTGVMGLTSTAAQFSVAMGTAAVGSQSHVCHLRCCYWILWGCGSAMIARRPVSGAMVLSLLCVPTHPPSDYRCIDLSCVLVC